MWWTPDVVDQAISRCYRPGQKKEVHIHMLNIVQTIEDRLLEICESKRDTAENLLGNDTVRPNSVKMNKELTQNL